MCLLYQLHVLCTTADYGPIILIATHVDMTRGALKTQNGEWICPDAQKTLETAKRLIPHAPNFQTVVIMDTNVPASYGFKQLKSIMSNLRQDCIQVCLVHVLLWCKICNIISGLPF